MEGNRKPSCLVPVLSALLLYTTFAPQARSAEPFDARAEVNWRYGSERSILMTEFWVPFLQDEDSVLYGDLRMMGDDAENREGNIGIGYRQLLAGYSGVAGIHLWMDRRITERGSHFHQVTAGAEWLGESFDLLANVYVPLSDEKRYTVPNPDAAGPVLAGTAIYVDTNGEILEEPQKGFDIELGTPVPFLEKNIDNFKAYGGGYYFNGPHTERVTGWRARISADVTPDIELGARFQRDDERGSQGFLEATIRFPFGQKKSYWREGLRARLDESPERDIDIVSGQAVTDTGDRVLVVNKDTGRAQRVLHVDNTAEAGGDGSAERPFDALAAAQAVADAHDVIYLHTGDGTSAGQNTGIMLSRTGQQLIGAGVDFVYDGTRFKTINGVMPLVTVLAKASSAPVVTNAGGDGITVTADRVALSGLTVDGAANDGIAVTGNDVSLSSLTSSNNMRHGIYSLNTEEISISSVNTNGNVEDGVRLQASGAGFSASGTISGISATGNKNGIRFYAHNDASLNASMTGSVTTGNTQHGTIVYDDSAAGSVIADLGGGAFGSAGINILTGNGLEDLAIDLDGGTLYAQNNWWGQATGLYQDIPSGPLKPQIYYGAPVNDSLVSHFTLDEEWISGTIAYDRSAIGANGSMNGGISDANLVDCEKRNCLSFDAINDRIVFSNVTMPTTAITLIIWVRQQNHVNWYDFYTNNWSNIANPTSWNFLTPTDGSLFFGFWGTGTGGQRAARTPAGSVSTGVWNMLVGSYDGTTISASINAGNPATFVFPGIIIRNDLSFRIGEQNSAGVQSYLLDDARVYSRALSPSEIAELYRMDTTTVVDTASFLTSAP